jgi:hypothetical protein
LSALAAGLSRAQDPRKRYESDPLTGEREGPDLTFAERYVGSAREVEKLGTVRAFAARYPEINDALPYLGVPSDQGAQRIHELYRRHAAGVCGAIKAAFRAQTDGLYWQSFSPRSLLGVVLGRAAPAPRTAVPAVPQPERGFVVDRGQFQVRLDGAPCTLGNTKEFCFVERLNRARGVWLSVERLGEDVWEDAGVAKNTVQAVASNLRRKLREAGLGAVLVDGNQKGHYRLVAPRA